MTSETIVPKSEPLRRAVRWLAENPPVTAAKIADAARRFDLSPLDEGFLLGECRNRRPPTGDPE